jgi:hypothetical protein
MFMPSGFVDPVVMVYDEVDSWLVVYPGATAIALNVSLVVIVIALVYCGLAVVGVLPSIV